MDGSGPTGMMAVTTLPDDPKGADPMISSQPTTAPCKRSSRLASVLDRRLAMLLLGAVLARGRRTVTSWIRFFEPMFKIVTP